MKITAKEQANLMLLEFCYNKSTYDPQNGQPYLISGMDSAIIMAKFMLIEIDKYLPKEVADYWVDVLAELEMMKTKSVERQLEQTTKDSVYDDQA
jgi:hypothetical protein